MKYHCCEQVSSSDLPRQQQSRQTEAQADIQGIDRALVTVNSTDIPS